MFDRLEITVQVQHHVGVAGQALQGQSQRLQLGGRRYGIQRRQQAVPYQRTIVLCVGRESGFDVITDLSAEVAEPAIEVLAAFQLVAAQRGVHQHLFQADRVGHGHHDDFAQQAPGVFQFGQTLLQVPGHQHARQLVGMQ